MWGELVPLKIFNPAFPVLKAGYSVSYFCICDVCKEWVNFFLKIPVWLVCYAHVFHAYVLCLVYMVSALPSLETFLLLFHSFLFLNFSRVQSHTPFLQSMGHVHREKQP